METTQTAPETKTETVQETKPETQEVQTVQQQAPPPDPLESLTIEQIAERFRDRREDVFKALGVDDFALEAVKYYEAKGNLAEYAEVHSVDYNKLSDEQIVERMLKEQYANMKLEPEELKLLVESEMAERFKLDPETYSEREVQLAKIKLKAEASKGRETFIDRQSKFKAPERVKETPTQAPSRAEQLAFARQELLKQENVRQFLEGKKVQFGDPSSPYNYEVETPEEVLSVMYDNDKWLESLAQKDASGQVLLKDGFPVIDQAKALKVAAYAKNPTAIETNLINYGKMLGKKEAEDENEQLPDKTHGTDHKPKTVFDALDETLQNRR